MKGGDYLIHHNTPHTPPVGNRWAVGCRMDRTPNLYGRRRVPAINQKKNLEEQRKYHESRDMYSEVVGPSDFCICTCDGSGRENEFPIQGRGMGDRQYPQRRTESRGRIRNSKHRFNEWPRHVDSDERQRVLEMEGLMGQKCSTSLQGAGVSQICSGVKYLSMGTKDNFNHYRNPHKFINL
eukprot:GHVR01113588.1.p1 GENE.GHVR01113588.1~~GHVR01113588.1.p1  ORF type:complete len:181 (+),score=40.05 GHVR01113588.1:123-665(+)